MDNDFRKEIEDGMNELNAQLRAYQVLLHIITAEMAWKSKDWRGQLDVMRSNCDAAVLRYVFQSGDPDENEALRGRVLHHVRHHFDETFGSLLDLQTRKRPGR